MKAYLRNGEEVYLHQQVDDNTCIIEKYVDFYDDEGDLYDTDLSGEKVVVSEVFKTPPIAHVNENIKKATDRLKKVQESIALAEEKHADTSIKLHEAQKELKAIKLEKTNLAEGIVNKSEFLKAKRIVFFAKDMPNPYEAGKKQSLSELEIRLLISFSQNEKGEVFRTLEWHFDEWDGYKKIDKDYPIMFDPTNEEVEKASKNRLVEIWDKLPQYKKKQANDNLLNEDMKKDLIRLENIEKISDLKDNIEKIEYLKEKVKEQELYLDSIGIKY